MNVKIFFSRCCIIACIMALGVACSNRNGSQFIIEGKLSGVEDGVVVSLLGFEDDTIRKGRFRFTGETELDAEQLGIMIMNDGPVSMPVLPVWVASGAKIKISGAGKMTPLWEVKSSVPNQKEENLYMAANRDNLAEQIRINVELVDLQIKSRSASLEEEILAYREVSSSLNTKLDSLRIMEIYTNINVMEKTDVSPIWLGKMIRFVNMLYGRRATLSVEQSGYLTKKAWELYDKMSEEDRNTPAGTQISLRMGQL